MHFWLPCYVPLFYREERLNFIRAKYVEKRYAITTCSSDMEKLFELEEAVNRGDLSLLLQVFSENVDLGSCLPSSVRLEVNFASQILIF